MYHAPFIIILSFALTHVFSLCEFKSSLNYISEFGHRKSCPVILPLTAYLQDSVSIIWWVWLDLTVLCHMYNCFKLLNSLTVRVVFFFFFLGMFSQHSSMHHQMVLYCIRLTWSFLMVSSLTVKSLGHFCFLFFFFFFKFFFNKYRRKIHIPFFFLNRILGFSICLLLWGKKESERGWGVVFMFCFLAQTQMSWGFKLSCRDLLTLILFYLCLQVQIGIFIKL